MNEPLNHELLSFIGKSPTVFHAVDTMKAQLAEAGFIPCLLYTSHLQRQSLY